MTEFLTVSRGDFARATLLVHPEGARYEAISEDGEVCFDGGFPAGVHALSVLLPFSAGVAELHVVGASVVWPNGRQLVSEHPLRLQAGARPDFVPRNNADLSLRVDLMLRKLGERAAALERREESFAALAEAARCDALVDAGGEYGETASAPANVDPTPDPA